jgi:hypothetical protein
MKKTSIKLLFISLVVMSTVGCVKDAEVTAYLTNNKLNELAAEDPGSIFTATVNGMLSDLTNYAYSDQQHNWFGQKGFDYQVSLMGNDMIMTGRFGMSLNHHIFNYYLASSRDTDNHWREYYRVIDNANKILISIDPETDDPVSLKFKAIALGLRGYAYAQLTYYYQFSYYVGADDTKWGKGAKYDHSQALCVPIITETITGSQPRATVAQVYDQLIGDLTTAYEIFEDLDMLKTSSPIDVDGCVVAQYLARAYMVKHDWDNAIKYAQMVIDNFPILQGREQLTQGFSNIALPDVVFGADITSDNSGIYKSFFSQMDYYADGYAGIGVWRAGFKPLVDRIGDNDVRLLWFATERGNGLGPDGRPYILDLEPFGAGGQAQVNYQSVKFVGTGRENIKAGNFSGWELGDYIYLRSEEAYFMKMESLAHKGDASAVTELNNFMTKRDASYQYAFSDKAALIEEINFQKRVEFWGEGIEFLDNRRLNIPVDRTDATWGAANNHLDGAKILMQQEDLRMRYQIPLSEIENNDMIPLSDQNPI